MSLILALLAALLVGVATLTDVYADFLCLCSLLCCLCSLVLTINR